MIKEVLEKKPDGLRSLEGFVSLFSDLIHKAKIYPGSHGYMSKLYEHFCEEINGLIGSHSQIIFRRIGTQLYHNNFRVDISGRNGSGIYLMNEVMKKMSIGAMKLEKGVEVGEIKAFVEICLCILKDDRTSDISARWRRINRIRIDNNKIVKDETPGGKDIMNDISSAIGSENRRKKDSVGGAIGDVLQKLQKIESTRKKAAGGRIIDLISDENRYNYAIYLLKSLKAYDFYTFNHSVNVSVISTAMVTRLGWSDGDRDRIGIAALLHDIGKVHIPRKILHKDGKLTPMEWKYIKKHPVDGMNILKDENAEKYIQKVAYEHHMRFDKTGYPNAFDDYKINDAAHIVQIADSYDALTTKRPYRKQLNPFEAVSFMQKKRGTEFHPGFIDLFMTILGNVPIGSIVELNSGETVIIVEAAQDAGVLPVVRVIKDAAGSSVGKEILYDLNDKTDKGGVFLRSIKNVIDNPMRDIDIGEYTMGRK